MIIGKNWNSSAPKIAKQLKYFTFKPAKNCHWWIEPASLQVVFESKDIQSIVYELQKFHKKYNEFNLTLNYNDSVIEISITSKIFFDYEFYAALYIEELLGKHIIHKIDTLSDYDKENTISCKAVQTDDESAGIIQILSREKDADNSEQLSLRYDCNADKDNFDLVKKELINIAVNNNIEQVKICVGHCENRINIMVFFENGRQGVKLKAKTNVNISEVESAIKIIEQSKIAERGFVGAYENYPDTYNKIIIAGALD